MSGEGARALLRDTFFVTALALICLLLIEILGQAAWHEDPYIYVIVDRGMPFAQIADRFKQSGLIKSDLLFVMLGRLFHIERRAKSGRYRFKNTANLGSMLNNLYQGATYRERVAIHPGKTIEHIGRMLHAAGVDSGVFVSLAEDSMFASSLGIPSNSAEGYLLPDTYDIEWREDPKIIIRMMVSQFLDTFDDSMRARTASLGMTMNETVTLASIIEKEALLDEERPKISAVFHNRLKRGMRLQADPTVRYALRKWTDPLLYRDLKVDSPFNTYRVYGLPPRPICNPGIESLNAALYPTSGSKDLYFVAQGDGSHYFSKSVQEHLRAKARYKQYLQSLKMGDEDATQKNQ